MEPLIPKHGGYRKLGSFQIAQLCYDVTVRFCDRYVDKRSRTGLVRRRYGTAEEVAVWVSVIHGRDGQRRRPEGSSMRSILSSQSTFSEIAANAALVLIGVACALLDRQIEALARAFTEEGGLSERLHRIRTKARRTT